MKFLVFNLGLKSLRAIVFEAKGAVVFQKSYPLQTTLYGIEVEQDVNEWWEKMEILIEDMRAQSGLLESITHVTFTGSSSCLVAVDDRGDPVRPVIMVSDRRAVKEGQEVNMDASLMWPKIMWMKKHEPAVYKKTKKFLSPNDFFIRKWTGKAITDPYNASKYGFENERWSDGLLQTLEGSMDRLPEVQPVGYVVGPLLPEYIERWGIRGQVILTTYDAICSLIGAGIQNENDLSDVSGTVTSLRAVLSRPVKDPAQRVFTLEGLQSGEYIVGGSNNLGGGIIEWTKELLFPDEKDPYAVMIDEATKSAPGANGVLFLPYLLGERCPIWDPDAKGVFFGLQRGHQRKQLIRSVFEGVALSIKTVIEVLQEMGIQPQRIFASGGLTQIPLISQIKADVTQLEVHVPANFESTALGAAILMAVANGTYPDWKTAAAHMVTIETIFYPNTKLKEFYEDLYDVYKALYQATKMMYKKHSHFHIRHEAMLNDYLTHLHNL